MFFEKTECLTTTYKSDSLMGKLPKRTMYIQESLFHTFFFFGCEFGSYFNQLLHHTYINFSLSKKIIFFSPILANNNLPLKIYCESIVKIF